MQVWIAVVTVGKSKPSIAGVFTNSFEDWLRAYYLAGGFAEIEILHTNGITQVYFGGSDSYDTWNLEVHDVDAEPTW